MVALDLSLDLAQFAVAPSCSCFGSESWVGSVFSSPCILREWPWRSTSLLNVTLIAAVLTFLPVRCVFYRSPCTCSELQKIPSTLQYLTRPCEISARRAWYLESPRDLNRVVERLVTIRPRMGLVKQPWGLLGHANVIRFFVTLLCSNPRRSRTI